MDNFFLSKLDLEDLYTGIFDNPEIIDMYFQNDEENYMDEENTELNLEELLASFESESEETISIKIGLIKEIKNKNTQIDKYGLLYLVDSYINKYFYNMITYQDKEFLSLIN
jgi:hypothetical protein